jgi:hypothetical protein
LLNKALGERKTTAPPGLSYHQAVDNPLDSLILFKRGISCRGE